MVARDGFVGCGGSCPLDRPLAATLRGCGGSAWWASLAPPVADFILAVGRAAAFHSAPLALGGFAQHGVGRAPTLSAQEASHRRTTLEQTEFVACARARNSFACFSDPAMHAPYGWLGAGVCGRAWARACLLSQALARRHCRLAGCITAFFFAAPNLAPAQVGAQRGAR